MAIARHSVETGADSPHILRSMEKKMFKYDEKRKVRYQKCQTKLRQMKNILSNMKNPKCELNRRLDTEERKINEL